MKKLTFLIFIAIFTLTGCKQAMVDKDAVKASITSQMALYPESRLQDLYKSFFQDRFGPGHIIKDRQSALDYIISELASADTLIGPITESCGWQGNYVRVNLSVIDDGLMTAEQMADALMASAKEVKEQDIERWKTEWAEIVAIIEKEYPDIPDLASDKAKIEELLASGQYAYHHSDVYNAAYHPHYRIIAKVLLNLDRVMPITVNLRYTGSNGNALKFAEEMISTGTVEAIRAEAGNLRYEYFRSLDDPETILLIDSWTSQEAIDAHHASPMMATIATLREKYDLHMTVERYNSAETPETESKFIRK